MKHIQFFSRSILTILCILVLCACESPEYLNGTKHFLSDEVHKYMADTTITKFNMTDNVGISETFYVEKSNFGSYQWPHHHYFSLFHITGSIKAYGYAENFNIAYKSAFSNYTFRFELNSRSDNKTHLIVKWGEDDIEFEKKKYDDADNWFTYDFTDRKVTSRLKPKIRFAESMTIRNTTFYDIIEIDFSEISESKRMDAPYKITFAGKKGLIKFEPVKGIELTRID